MEQRVCNKGHAREQTKAEDYRNAAQEDAGRVWTLHGIDVRLRFGFFSVL
jgi:hypothetical protein